MTPAQPPDRATRIGRHIKLRQLHILTTVVEAGSMGKAAIALAVSQPVVSKSIAELELAVGQRLLDRSKRGVTPTIYGRALLDCSAAVFDELRQGVRAIEFLADPSAGEARIGCTEPAAMGFVPAVIDRLSRRYPRVVIHVVTGESSALVARELRERRIELVISAVPGAETAADVKVDPLFEDLHVVVAGGSNRWVRRRRIALADLVDEPWILPPLDSASGQGIAQAFRSAGLSPPNSRVVAFSIPLCQQLLATGRFLAVLPATMQSLSPGTSLRQLDVKWPRIPREVAILTLKDRTSSPTAGLFIQAAQEVAKQWMFPFCPLRGGATGRRSGRARG